MPSTVCVYSRIWAYVTRRQGGEKAKPEAACIGSELGKDLDSAYRNAYLCLAIEAEALEVSLRIHRGRLVRRPEPEEASVEREERSARAAGSS